MPTASANGQSMFGTCGHYFTNPGFRNAPVNGPYNIGYGPINNAAMPCYIGLILAKKCGLTDPEILAGIERAGTFYAQYTHLGCAGYGEHLPYEGHDTNGKAGLQALAFELEGDRLESTKYYARASTAAAIAERDIGHTGSFFAFLYAPLGANVGGPDAMAYYFRETKWMYELARRWDGSFVYNSFSSGGVEVDSLVGQGRLPDGNAHAADLCHAFAPDLPDRQEPEHRQLDHACGNAGGLRRLGPHLQCPLPHHHRAAVRPHELVAQGAPLRRPGTQAAHGG